MPRPQRCRKVCTEPDYIVFSPDGIPNSETVTLTYDEYEAIRLVDLMQLTHNEAAAHMEVARTTLTEVYNTARNKIADSIINGKALNVCGGNYRICKGGSKICGDDCRKLRCSKKSKNITEKGTDIMRIAVTYENGQIFQHFGHTEQFKVYDVENGEIVLVDYKKNRHTDTDILREEYEGQLKIYAHALEKMTCMKVKECWLWAFTAKKAIKIDT